MNQQLVKYAPPEEVENVFEWARLCIVYKEHVSQQWAVHQYDASTSDGIKVYTTDTIADFYVSNKRLSQSQVLILRPCGTA